ncbi:MAG: FtsX-like permease family protein [Suipraeoptans sp.]
MLKKRAIRKDFFMEIRKTPGRFLSIFFIVALGVSFFSGIRATEPDMRYTADTFYDDSNLADIKAYSTYGVTKDEVKEFEKRDDIDIAEGGYSYDFLSTRDDNQVVLRVASMQDKLNKYEVEEGRLPQKSGECLVDSKLGFKIGDEINLTLGGDDDVLDTLKTDTLTVVGIGNSAFYVGFERGNTNIGTGTIDGFCVVTEDTFDLEAYTEVYMTVKGATDETVYTDDYDDLIDDKVSEMKSFTTGLADDRLADIKGEATEELEENRSEFEEERDKNQAELDDGAKQIAEGQEEISDGEEQITSGYSEIQSQQNTINSGWASYYDGLSQLEDGKASYEDGLAQYNDAVSEVDAQESQLAGLQQKIDYEKEQLAALPQTPENADAIEELTTAIVTDEATYNYAVAAIEEARSTLAQEKEKIDAGKAELDSNETLLANTYNQLVSGQGQLDAAKAELNSKQGELYEAKAELESKLAELEDGRKTFSEEIAKAEKEIADAEDDIADIKIPKWYVDDRSVFPDYTGYGDNAIRIGKIGQVFPTIFFLVAALISLTSMTRLVEEQRTAIGTLKALGYNNYTIAMKYIGYALLATLSGSVVGVLIGEKMYPYIIIYAYGMMYQNMHNIIIPYDLPLGLYATALAVVSILAATIFACFNELRERPAILMRPPAPKKGTRVFLERVGFIWKHLSFIWKSTIRNLMRYKKRFYMTLFGIGACMALLLTGFGIRDSIYDITNIQYNDLQTYQGMSFYKDDISSEELTDIEDYVNSKDSNISKYANAYMKNVTTANDRKKWDAYIFVPESIQSLDGLVNFRNRITHKEYQLSDDGVILTEKLAKELDLEVGDEIELEGTDKKAHIADICENYVGHYVYISPTYYKELFGEDVKYNNLLFETNSDEKSVITKTGEGIINRDGVLSVQYTSDMGRQMDDMISTLNLVIIVLIVAAALLAFVVLYNLNTVNISERCRELATIKVLGFYDMEVAKYVYRENIVLTVIGALIGCVMGFALHQYIIQTVEVEAVMFGRVINWPSYIYSILFTILFSVIVNVVMFYKLRKIDMVESLKSIE